MLLRNRIALLFVLSAAGLMLLVGMPLLLLWYWSEARLDAAVSDAGRASWGLAMEQMATPYEAIALPLAEDQAIATLLRQGELANIETRFRDAVTRAATSLAIVELSMANSDGTVLAQAHTREVGLEIDVARLDRWLSRGYPYVGLEYDAAERPYFVVVLRGPQGTLVWLAADFAQILPRLSVGENSDLFLTNRDGQLLLSSRPELWPELQDHFRHAGQTPDRLHRGHRELLVVPVALRNSNGASLGTLGIVRDTSQEWQRRRLILLIGIVTSALFLLAAGIGMYNYVRSQLATLADVTGVVRGLVRGNVFATTQRPSDKDEVGEIAAAVEVFREHALSLRRLQIQERLRMARQQSLIRQEMTQLAGTLDEPERGEVLTELERIDHGIQPEGHAPREDEAPLATGFRQMASRVRAQHERLSSLLEERTRDLAVVREALNERAQLTRLREEMAIARQMQMASLPATFPPYPGRTDFDIYATVEPAQEVGGDFYDFLLIGDHRLAILIGDVSGKGVSAALVVGTCRTLLRAALLRGAQPAEAAATANAALSADSDTGMFVTVFVGVIDLLTGVFRYANAGHNPPYLLAPGAAPRALPMTDGIAIGALDGVTYAEAEERLVPGAAVLLYTDGVTEAHGTALVLYGEPRLEATLRDCAAADARTIVATVQQSVDIFTAGAERADDMTLLALRYLGPAGSAV